MESNSTAIEGRASAPCSAFFACDSVTGRGQTNTWFTPQEIVTTLGPFDLDPCTQTFRPHDTAARHICEDAGQCGMASKWEGRVWLNPPYGKEIAKWLGKLADHGNGIALVFARTDTAWAQSILKRVDAANFMKGRVAFIPVGEKKPTANSSGTPSMLLAFGRENVDAIKRLPGVILLPNSVIERLPRNSTP